MSELKNELLGVLKEPGLPDDKLRRRLLEVLLEPVQPRKMTYEEFLAWAGEDTLAEWVDGEVEMTSPASGCSGSFWPRAMNCSLPSANPTVTGILSSRVSKIATGRA